MISALLVTSLLGAGSPSSPEVSASLSTVRRAFLEDGEDRVSITSAHRIVSHADGSLALQGELPLRISLRSVRRDRGVSCQTTLSAREIDSTSPLTVRTRRACGVEETWTNEPGGLEHAFILQRAPAGSGAITLHLEVEGPWHHADAQGQVFKGPGAATGWRYGSAFVLHGALRIPISVAHVEGGLELTVPQALAEAPDAFPMIIDPLLSMEQPLEPPSGVNVFQGLPTLEEAPAIAVNAAGNAMVVWVDGRRQLGTDIFGARFDVNGGLADNVGLPIVVEPGPQVHPTICAQGNSFLVAWEQPLQDGGANVRARTFNSSSGALSPPVFVAVGSQPSLATAGDAGFALLAYVDPTPTVRVLPIVGLDAGAALLRPVVTAGESPSRPTIAASNRSWFVAWEETRLGVFGTIKGMASSGGGPQLLDVSPSTATFATRRPTVALVSEISADSPLVYWEQGVNIGGARINNNIATQLPLITTASSPALVRASAVNLLPTLGFFSGGSLVLRDLNDGGTSINVGPRPDELALAVGNRLYATWTEGPYGGSDVMGLVLSTAASPTILMSQAALAQRAPHVAMKDDFSEGLAAWIEGANVIRGARANVQNGGLTFSGAFHIANQTQAIDQLDVAASVTGDLVTWRQGTAVFAQLTSATSTGGNNPISLSTLASGGPAVAWNEQLGGFVVAYSQGLNVVSKTVINGAASQVTNVGNGQASDLDIACLAGECLVVWERVDLARIDGAVIGGAIVPFFFRSQASHPAVSHDGKNFLLGWRSGSGRLSFAEVDFLTGQPTNLMLGVNSGVNNIDGLSLAPGVPPVLSWTEVAPNDETNVYLQRVDFIAPATRFDGGMLPIVATAGVEPGAQGVVVYQRYVPEDGMHVMRSFGTMFTFPFDAGTLDAGTLDAGVDAGTDAGVDAGLMVDAGQPAGDGGVDAGEAPADAGMAIFQTSGCNCDAGSTSAPLLVFALLALRRRRSGPQVSAHPPGLPHQGRRQVTGSFPARRGRWPGLPPRPPPSSSA